MKVNSDLNNRAIPINPVSAARAFNNLSGNVWFSIAGMDNKDTIAQNVTRKHNLHRHVKGAVNFAFLHGFR